jgi:hypothetical protein
MKTTLLLLQLCIVSVLAYAQHSEEVFNFDCVIRQAQGDLNQDGVLDKVIIDMDTVAKSRPLRFQLFFGQSDSSYALFFSSTDLIEAMYPTEKNGTYNGSQIPNVSIENGNLQIDFYSNGNSSYHFKYTHGNFELIYFTFSNWDGVSITETKFNFLTGAYSKRIQILETGEVTLNLNKEVILTPLPQLKHFKPFENELY